MVHTSGVAMLTGTALDTQLTEARADAPRVLVVGAGVAGATLAQLLRREGLHPVLVERGRPEAGHGYMLALMPMVDPVIAALDVRARYLAESVALRRYAVRAHTGRTLRVDDLARMLDAFGDYRGIGRGALLDVLTADGGTVSHGTTVGAVRPGPSGVRVTLVEDARRIDAEFDLVVAADGLHSATRDLVAGLGPVGGVDTGWGGWVAWIDADDGADLGEELWGAGFFVGSYPVRGRIGVFVGGPRADTADGPAAFAERIRGGLRTCDGRLERVLHGLAESGDFYYWPLVDRRAATWRAGRVVLLGDAAAGFLPTAGIGAGMAMESAGVLAGHLRAAGAHRIPEALAAYERAQRPRVEAAQDTSRRLARMMFRRSRLLAAARDVAVARVSADAVLGPVKNLLAHRPAVDAVRTAGGRR